MARIAKITDILDVDASVAPETGHVLRRAGKTWVPTHGVPYSEFYINDWTLWPARDLYVPGDFDTIAEAAKYAHQNFHHENVIIWIPAGVTTVDAVNGGGVLQHWGAPSGYIEVRGQGVGSSIIETGGADPLWLGEHQNIGLYDLTLKNTVNPGNQNGVVVSWGSQLYMADVQIEGWANGVIAQFGGSVQFQNTVTFHNCTSRGLMVRFNAFASIGDKYARTGTAPTTDIWAYYSGKVQATGMSTSGRTFSPAINTSDTSHAIIYTT